MRPDGSFAAIGEPGEVVIRGANVMRGYLNRPEATAEAVRGEGGFVIRCCANARDTTVRPKIARKIDNHTHLSFTAKPLAYSLSN